MRISLFSVQCARAASDARDREIALRGLAGCTLESRTHARVTSVQAEQLAWFVIATLAGSAVGLWLVSVL
jgi:hypothetical protein